MSLTHPIVKHERAHNPHHPNTGLTLVCVNVPTLAVLRFSLLPSAEPFRRFSLFFQAKRPKICVPSLGPAFQTLECSEVKPRINAAVRGRGD